MFGYQRNKAAEVEIISSQDQLQAILSWPEVKERVAQCRAYLDMGNKEAYDLCKRELPLLIFSAAYVDESTQKKSGKVGHWRTQATTHLNGLCTLDIDHMKEDPREVYARLTKEYPQYFGTEQPVRPWTILMVYVSPGYGLKVVFTADATLGNLADNQYLFSRALGLENDRSIKDSSRGQFATTLDDVLYLNKDLITYNDETFEEKFGAEYRKGNSAPTKAHPQDDAAEKQPTIEVHQLPQGEELKYGEIPVREIALRYEQYYGRPVEGDRHRYLIKVAGHFRYLVDNRPSKLKDALRQIPWVREWLEKENNDSEVDGIADAVCEYRMWREVPKALDAAIKGENPNADQGGAALEAPAAEDYAEVIAGEIWDRLRPLLADDPLFSLCTAHIDDPNKIAAIFVAGGMFATLATRTYYLHYDGKMTRMNPQVYVIGRPASGKSFADELDTAIMSVLRAADEPGRKAELDYKKEQKKRRTSNKAGKGEQQLKEPECVIRYIPSRTSNAVFYKRALNAKEVVEGEVMPLHLYTFDSELDSSVSAQSGGSWIGKHDLELKAFHNETSGVDYANADSVNENIPVYWNQVVTGTDVSLAKKVNIRNVNDGLCSRMAIIRIMQKPFRMIERRKLGEFQKTMDELKAWGARFDALRGEILVPKLVDHIYDYCEQVGKDAEKKQDAVLDYLRKRAVFYAEWFTIIRVLGRTMQQIDEGKELKLMKPIIRKSDLEFAELIMDTVIFYEDLFFGQMLEESWQNAKNSFVMRRSIRKTQNEESFEKLPQEFTVKQAIKVLNINYHAAAAQMNRWKNRGMIKRKGKSCVWQKC